MISYIFQYSSGRFIKHYISLQMQKFWNLIGFVNTDFVFSLHSWKVIAVSEESMKNVSCEILQKVDLYILLLAEYSLNRF